MQCAEILRKGAKLALEITGVGEPVWERKPEGGRRGPWLTGAYRVHDEAAWHLQKPCLYMVVREGEFRYFGISRQRLKTRWRLSPALDPQDRTRVIGKNIFHSQCWKHLEREMQERPGIPFFVYVIHGSDLIAMLSQHSDLPLSGLLALGNDEEGIVAAAERWFCNRQGVRFADWNSAMTLKYAKTA